jgi:hypothetical protein
MKKVSTGAAREKRNFQEQKLTQDQDWESPIQKFEEQDKVNPPKSGGAWFLRVPRVSLAGTRWRMK